MASGATLNGLQGGLDLALPAERVAPLNEQPAPSPIRIAGRLLHPTPVFDTYWRFAARRHAIYQVRLERRPGPWTDDPIPLRHRFTNCYRAADRVSQFLIRHVSYAGAQDMPGLTRAFAAGRKLHDSSAEGGISPQAQQSPAAAEVDDDHGRGGTHRAWRVTARGLRGVAVIPGDR
nr:nucleotide kinase domain-containing protein [Streptomyces albicerus]